MCFTLSRPVFAGFVRLQAGLPGVQVALQDRFLVKHGDA
jgi:hypothetical protein